LLLRRFTRSDIRPGSLAAGIVLSWRAKRAPKRSYQHDGYCETERNQDQDRGLEGFTGDNLIDPPSGGLKHSDHLLGSKVVLNGP
jgi:hypothetical protein